MAIPADRRLAVVTAASTLSREFAGIDPSADLNSSVHNRLMGRVEQVIIDARRVLCDRICVLDGLLFVEGRRVAHVTLSVSSARNLLARISETVASTVTQQPVTTALDPRAVERGMLVDFVTPNGGTVRSEVRATEVVGEYRTVRFLRVPAHSAIPADFRTLQPPALRVFKDEFILAFGRGGRVVDAVSAC